MKNIPNILSGIRILLIPFFVYNMKTDNMIGAGLVLIVSGLTDFLDGKLARRFGWITSLGKILDPIADKLTQMTVSLLFILKWGQYRSFFVVLIVKEFIMLTLGGWLIKKGVKLEGAQWYGKVNTSIFYGVMIAISLIPMKSKHIIPLLITAVISGALAIIMYIPEFVRCLKGIHMEKRCNLSGLFEKDGDLRYNQSQSGR